MSKLDSFLEKYKHHIILVMAFTTLIMLFIYSAFTIDGRAIPKILMAILVLYGCSVIGSLFFLFKLKKQIPIEKTFIVAFLATGLIYMAIFVPLKAPDEQSHFSAAYRYSNILLGQEGTGYNVPMRADDAAELKYWWRDHRDLSNDYHELKERFSLFCQDSSIVEYEQTRYFSFAVSSRPPQMHLPAAIGLTVGRMLDLGAIPVYYLGRLTAFLFFALCAYFAVKITPVGKMPFVVVSFLPITLQLATSYSYDCSIIALSLLLSACCMRSVYKKGYITKKEVITILGLIFLFAPCKTVYCVVGLLALFVPKERFKTKKNSILFRLGVLLCIVVPIFALSASAIFSLASASGDPGHNSSGSPDGENYVPTISFSMVLSDPVWALGMYLNTFFSYSSDHVQGFFGGLMAWGKDLPGPWYIVVIFSVLLAFSVFSDRSKVQVRSSQRLICCLLFAASAALVYASMLVGWTAVDSSYIKGIQGRYFIPIIPLLIIALSSMKNSFTKDISKPILMTAVFIDVYYGVWLFAEMLSM